MRGKTYDTYNFRIAGHRMEVLSHSAYFLPKLLPAFNHFACKETPDDIPILRARIICSSMDKPESTRLLSCDFGAFSSVSHLYASEEYYFIELSCFRRSGFHQMRVSKDFSVSYIFIERADDYAGDALSFFLMFAFAQRGVYYNTFLLHASVVYDTSGAYAFLGKSGTGKSTHSHLWLKHLDGFTLLNDDNPAVRYCRDTGSVFISGTPWSGKTKCYTPQTFPLRAVVRLSQAKENTLLWLDEPHALLAILCGASSMRWDFEHYMYLCNILERVVEKVPLGLLECLPNVQAAELCYEKIKTKIRNEKD